MSGKLLHAFTDDNPDLHKQIGCMSGIFQMFDRHHLLAGRRLNRKRLPSGDDLIHGKHLQAESNSCSPRIVLEKNLSKSLNENQRVSVESSRASFSSSSCSSSFSSLECNKSTQQEPSPFERSTFVKRSVKNSQMLQSSETKSGLHPLSPCQHPQNLSATSCRQSLDFRDVVKDSIYRDINSLSVKTSNKEEVKEHVMKHRDSPRPLPLLETIGVPCQTAKNEKTKMSEDLNKSIQVLAKLKEAPRYFSENKPPRSSNQAKDGSFFPTVQEVPRFSYDGREICCSSVDSREHNKCSTKLKELPRLSLDSRQSSMRSSSFDSKSNSLMEDLESIEANQATYRSLTLQQDLDTPRRSTSVVAKLMGLEEMPLSSGMQDHMHLSNRHTNDINSFIGPKTINPSTKSLKMPGESKSKQEWLSCSPKGSTRDPTTPRSSPAELVIKPISISKIPIETAPWKRGKSHGKTRKMAFGSRDSHIRQQHESVYSEIERKLKELEFQQSNKDLRALKQILDAIQAKGQPESKKDGTLSSDIPDKKSNVHQVVVGIGQNLRTANRQNPCIARPHTRLTNGANTTRPPEAPIVIMKPAKSIYRSSVPASSMIPFDGLSSLRKVHTGNATDVRKNPVNNCLTKEQTLNLNLREPAVQILLSPGKKSNRHEQENSSHRAHVHMAQVSPRPQKPTRENNGSTIKTPGSVSPRVQQKKLELEKKSCPPIPSEPAKSRKQSTTRHIVESVSPRSKVRPKSEQVLQNSDKSSEASSDTGILSHHSDEISLRRDRNINLELQLDREVASADQSVELTSVLGSQIPADTAVSGIASTIKQKKSLKDFSEDASAELSTISVDQPSPVSVLDASFYRDDLPPSPINRISNSCRAGNAAQNSDTPTGVIRKTAGPDSHLPNNPMCDLSSTLYHRKLESVENLLQKLRKLSLSNSDESPIASHMASLCEMQSPEHRYISEVLLASGLLNTAPDSPMPIRLHKSGYAMDPSIFLVLEQTKMGIVKPSPLHESTARSTCDQEKLPRRLLFDTVNEILTQKLQLAGTGPLRPDGGKVADRMPTGQHLLKELCMEIERLKAYGQGAFSFDDEDDSLKPMLCEEVARLSEGWKASGKEVAGLVLDIERSIFRDLINEVVNGEAAAFVLAAKPSRRRRQLFC